MHALQGDLLWCLGPHVPRAECPFTQHLHAGGEETGTDGDTVTFSGAWDLMFHVQNAHSLNIYTLVEKRQVRMEILLPVKVHTHSMNNTDAGTGTRTVTCTMQKY